VVAVLSEALSGLLDLLDRVLARVPAVHRELLLLQVLGDVQLRQYEPRRAAE
jgi:hypothetical protein